MKIERELIRLFFAWGVPSFSEQHLIDCDTIPNMGCYGGQAQYALRYVKEYGIALRSEYPYESEFKECRYDEQSMKAFGIQDFKYF